MKPLNGFKAIGGNVYNGTLGIMSLMAPFFIGSALAEERKVDPMAAGLLAVAAFMTVTPYSVGRSLCGGRQLVGRGRTSSPGLIIGLVVAELFTFVIRRNWVIRLAGQRAGVGITLFLSADSGLLDPLHLRHYLVGPGELWQQLPPDHHGLYLDAAGGDGQRGWLGIRYL